MTRRRLLFIAALLAAQAAVAQVPVGSEFQVNTYTTSDQREPVIVSETDGDFVVVWESDGSDNGDTSGRTIQGQRYSSDGIGVGSEFLVNTYTTSWPVVSPAVAAAPAGDLRRRLVQRRLGRQQTLRCRASRVSASLPTPVPSVLSSRSTPTPRVGQDSIRRSR